MTDHVLTINAGSSSLKFSLRRAEAGAAPLLVGQVERIGSESPRLLARAGEERPEPRTLPRDEARDAEGAMRVVLGLVGDRAGDARVAAVGHRVVHGGPDRGAPAVLDDAEVAALAELNPLAPLHQPHNLAAIAAARRAFPEAVQVACFDTAFHRGRPFEAEAFAVPRAYFDRGVRRYGFHGLSYDFIAGELARTRPELAAGRVVVAHLGAGASMCAMRDGRSVDTTMGLSALDGLPMGTRCGQLDPGVVLWLLETEGMDAAGIGDLLYRKSGLLGLSGVSSDMRELEASDAREAAEAIGHFCFRIRREIGGLAASLGGLDALVFTAGIGEHSARIRAEVCGGLGWLGVEIDAEANARHAADISASGAPVKVLVMPTDEEAVIARAALRALERAGA